MLMFATCVVMFCALAVISVSQHHNNDSLAL